MPGGHRNGVFLSYARADGESLAHALHARITRELPWALESGADVRTLHGHTGAVCDVAVTRDGCRAISASMDHTLKVWNISTDTSSTAARRHGKSANRATTAADLRTALALGPTSGSQIDHATELRILRDLGIGPLAVTPDGRFAMKFVGADMIAITDGAESVEIRRFKGFPGRLTAAGMTPDGRRAAVVSDDGTVTVWDRDTESDMPCYQAQPGVKCLLSPDARWVIAFNWSVAQPLIDLNTGQVVRITTGAGTNDFFTRSPEGRYVLCCRRNEILDIVDLESDTKLYSLKTDSAYGVQAVRLMENGGHAVTSSRQLLSCWDLESGERVATFIPERPITASSLSSDTRIVIAVDDGTIHCLSVETATPVRDRQ